MVITAYLVVIIIVSYSYINVIVGKHWIVNSEAVMGNAYVVNEVVFVMVENVIVYIKVIGISSDL